MLQSGHLQQTPSWGHCQVGPQHSKGWALGQPPARECKVFIRPGPVVPQAPYPKAGQLAGLSLSCRVDSQVSGSPRSMARPPAPPSRCWRPLLSDDKALLYFPCCFRPACPQIISPDNFSRSYYNFKVPVTSDLYPLGNSKT